jgi:large subunit ribosomal protein L24
MGIKKGDKVLVIAGNDKGRTGVVLRRKEDRVAVQGINIRKRHVKKRSQNMPSQIIEMEVPVHISNVCLCDDDGKRAKKVKAHV